MALSMAQKHLIAGLKLFGVEKESIVGIVSALQEPEQLDEMMEWMCEHSGNFEKNGGAGKVNAKPTNSPDIRFSLKNPEAASIYKIVLTNRR